MKSTDRTILIALGVAGLFAAFWFLALAPKRDEAKELGDKVAQLESDIAAQEAIVVEGSAAQTDYERNFSTLVTLGRAAPANGDMPGLLEQLVSISKTADTGFEVLTQGAAVEEPQPAVAESTVDPGTEAPPAEGEAPPASEGAPASTPVSAAPATEASAATLPLGATVGSAGLGILPYDVKFTGDFFEIADLFKGMDQLIESEAARVDVGGRLITVNRFEMTKVDTASPLEVEVSLSTYVLPESQGLTAGATSTAPPAAVPTATPVAEATP